MGLSLTEYLKYLPYIMERPSDSLTLCYFSEFGLGVWALVSVRVVLEGQLVEGLLDLALGGVSGDPQYVVVVPLGQDEL